MIEKISFSLQPVDNQRLARLCGVLDTNLHHIERALSVKINRRGEQFRLDGEAAPFAAEMIKRLYQDADVDIKIDDVRSHLGKQFAEVSEKIEKFPKVKQRKNDIPSPRKKQFTPWTKNQQTYQEKIEKCSIVLCTGPAGTGKTHVAVSTALKLAFFSPQIPINRLVLSRPVIEAGGEKLGFLPGDMEQKINPYLRPLYDVLYQLLERSELERYLAENEIEIIPLAFMRGITLNNAILVLDEAQNTTPSQMKMLLSRLGENSKIVASGDHTQSDLELNGKSGLTDALMRLADIKDIDSHVFLKKDIVRHPLVCDILDAYEREHNGDLKLQHG